MGFGFWVRRFAWVYAIAFVAIGAGQWLLRARSPAEAATHAAVWSALAAGVFTATRLYRSRRGEHCALCRDTPETQ